jgi:hypothetical protein
MSCVLYGPEMGESKFEPELRPVRFGRVVIRAKIVAENDAALLGHDQIVNEKPQRVKYWKAARMSSWYLAG